jgi:carboxymethylenebutenolidase
MRDLTRRKGRSFDEIDATRAWLSGNSDCTGSIGIIGYCTGGGFSLLLASDVNYSASSINYGEVPEDAELVLVTACPVVGSFGAKDRSLKGAANKLEKALTADGVSCDVKEYTDAAHGFLNEHHGAVGVLIAVIGRLMGVGYHEAAAADARGRIVAFFDCYLRPG